MERPQLASELAEDHQLPTLLMSWYLQERLQVGACNLQVTPITVSVLQINTEVRASQLAQA